MPSAISGKGQQALEDLIDGLAGEPSGEKVKNSRRIVWPWFGGMATAAAAVGFAFLLPDAPESKQASQALANDSNEGVVLLSQTEKVEAAQPENWMSESDGVAYRAWRVRVVDQDRFQDVETGYEVIVSHPRDEVRLLPVTTF